ncbi:MAG: T9SS type A sorting domain-containing protein [Bacteroidales bacterium]|nr:T9SS type A sorting domain-containing protein [Bacteroidales bacterium]
MKKIFYIIQFVLFLLFTFAGQAQTINTKAGTIASCSNNIVVPITVTNCNGVGAISLVLNYNNTQVSYLGYQNTHTELSSGFFIVNATSTQVIISWANTSAIDIGNDTLIELIFNANIGTSNLTWNTQTLGNCEYSDPLGNILDASFTGGSLTLHNLPSITSNPVNRKVINGQGTSFSITASGTGLTYRWQLSTDDGITYNNLTNSAPHSGTTTATLNISSTTLLMNGNKYRCRITGTCEPEQFSDEAILTVMNPVTTSLPSFNVCPGTIKVPVVTNNFTDVGAFSLTFSYNTTNLTYNSYENLNAELSTGNFVISDIGGKIYMTWASTAPVTFVNDTLIVLEFTNSAGTSALTWDTQTSGNCEYSDEFGDILPVIFQNGNLVTYAIPLVTSQPVDRTVALGQNTTFAILATGSGLTYRWQISTDSGVTYSDLNNGGNYSNVTNKTLTISNIPLSFDGNIYRCKVSGTCSPEAYSDEGLLTVLTNVTTNGQTYTTCPGSANFEISVREFNNIGSFSMCLNYNSSVLSYTGYQNLHPNLSSGMMSINDTDGKVYLTWSNTSSATIPYDAVLIELQFTSLPGTSSMTWDTQTLGNCEYSNINGQIVNSTWDNSTLTFRQPPVITSQPVDKTIHGSGNTSFSVSAFGTNITYRWMESTDGGFNWTDLINGTPYSGVTTSILKINPTSESMNGYLYKCRVSGLCEPVAVSDSALLTVTTIAIYTSVQNTNFSCDGEVKVPILVDNCNNVGSISLALNYDSTKLTFLGYQDLHTDLSSGLIIVNSSGTKVYFSWASTNPANITNDTLLILLFQDDAGASTNLTWDTQTSGNCEYSDPMGNILTSLYTNGFVNITTVYPTYYELDTATICDGENFIFGTQTLTTAGNYTEVFQSQHGCDSTITLTLFVNPLPVLSCPADTIVCLNSANFILTGASPIGGIYSGTTVNSDIFDPILAGIGIHDIAYTYIDANSCENSCLFQISVFPNYEFITDTEICDGDILSWQGNDYSVAGTYYDSLMTTVGCDSVYVLNLTVNPSYEFVTNTEICAGELFNWQGNDYYVTGTYYDSFSTTVGCDSVYVLNLTVNPTYEFITNAEICDGDLFSWQGNDYSVTGTYYDSLTTTVGCDSVYVLNLTINELPVVSISGIDNFYCVYADPVSMIGTPSGGTFSGQGVNGNIFDPSAAGLGLWPIVYEYTDANTCTNTDTVFVDIDDCVNIEESTLNNIEIYPNPTNGIINISADQNYIVEVLDLTGRIIESVNMNNNDISIDLTSKNSGMYIIRLTNGNGTKTVKVIKK